MTWPDQPHVDPREAASLREGLGRPLAEIDCRYFYDDVGSELFERITETPEYYPTRTELSILEARADEFTRIVQPRELVELGSGAGTKIRLLLDAAVALGSLERCVMLDINRTFLQNSVARLRDAYPSVEVSGIVGDFHTDLALIGPSPGRRMVVFLAGTVGNLHPDLEVPAFLRSVAEVLDDDGAMLLGVDLVKDKDVVEAAYDDAAGWTAAFNKNALAVVNRRFGADFVLDDWAHRAFYDERQAWIEMRLVAVRPTSVHIPSLGVHRTFAVGEEIRTELSCKYTAASLGERAAGTGLRIDRWATDAGERFALALLRPESSP